MEDASQSGDYMLWRTIIVRDVGDASSNGGLSLFDLKTKLNWRSEGQSVD